MNVEQANYPGFDYKASQLSAFVLSIDMFIIALKNGKVINFRPPDVEGFKKWLYIHHIRDIRTDDGITKRTSQQ